MTTSDSIGTGHRPFSVSLFRTVTLPPRLAMRTSDGRDDISMNTRLEGCLDWLLVCGADALAASCGGVERELVVGGATGLLGGEGAAVVGGGGGVSACGSFTRTSTW